MTNLEWDRLGLAALAGLLSGTAGAAWGLSTIHATAITLWIYAGSLLIERAVKHD